MTHVIPVILCGGAGSRLWPASREDFPKQLLAFGNGRSLFQSTLARVLGNGFGRPIVIVGDEYRFLVSEQLAALGAEADIVLEPMRRDSCAAAVVAADLAAVRDPDAVVALLAADHVISDTKSFLSHLDMAAPAACSGYLVAFGIQPRSPATAYGYIQPGPMLNDAPPLRRIAAFVEKPDRGTADRLVRENCLWNSGNFLFGAEALLGEAEYLAPSVAGPARAAVRQARKDLDFIRLDAGAFAEAEPISIDYSIMERTERAAVLPSTFDWFDLGSWEAVWEIAGKDENRNVAAGDAIFADARDCYVSSPNTLTVVLGLEDVIVVNTRDATLVASKSHAEQVKSVVERLKQMGRGEAVVHLRSYRPWGDYEPIDRGGRYQVKRITVKPGGKLSLQSHRHRAEHWVVVSGSALVTVDGTTERLCENESAYIPVGSVHRLENPDDTPLQLIEVQCGDYLGEDDIVRYDDIYNRAEKTNVRNGSSTNESE